MEKKGAFTKILAGAGTVLTWFPLLIPILFSIIGSLRSGRFLFDYLMPAELFPVALLGGALLLWAALRAKQRRGMIGWGVGAAAGLLAACMATAVVSGLASGVTEAGGWQWTLVLGFLAGYVLALLETGLGGILLVRDLSGSVQAQS